MTRITLQCGAVLHACTWMWVETRKEGKSRDNQLIHNCKLFIRKTQSKE